MNREQQPPLMEELKSTAQILRQAAASFISNLTAFLLLSLLLFSFRSFLLHSSSLLTSFVDLDPSLPSLLSRLSSSSSPPPPHRRRPLHLTRLHNQDHDDVTTTSSLFHPQQPPFFISSEKLGLGLGFNSSSAVVSALDHSALSFKPSSSSSSAAAADEKDDGSNDRSMDLRFVVNGIELGQRDAAALLFLVGFLSAAYGWVILAFVVTYSCLLGVVFTAVVNNLIGRVNSVFWIVFDGMRLGVRRLSGFVLMRWAVRDAMTQLLGLWWFGDIEDQFSFFKIFIRLKLMPFSVMTTWNNGVYEKEVSGFLLMWVVADVVVGFVFAVDAWIAIVDSRKSGKEIVKEGMQLVGSMFRQAVEIKCLEVVVCGSSVKWGVGRIFGRMFARVFQSTVEVYFMVAWLIFYFAARARCRDGSSSQGDRIGILH